MTSKAPDPGVSNNVEIVVRRLDCLATLPVIAARLLPQLVPAQISTATIADITESDAALTAMIFSLAHEQGLSLPGEPPSARRILEKLGPNVIREALFALKVFRPFNHDSLQKQRMLRRARLALHTLAVACCAKRIAEIASPKMDVRSAYLAGLLHDIGKLALDDVMPKSYERIIEEAKSLSLPLHALEQKYLGADHTTLGKRLAQKWRLPSQVTLAIWLHHNDTVTIAQNMPGTEIVSAVQLADSLVRQCNIGESGNYESPRAQTIETVAASLGIKVEQLEQVRRDLPAAVEEKARPSGLDLANGETAYLDSVQTAAAQLARDNSRLSGENRQLSTASSHFTFLTEFLSSIDSNTPPIDIAENFAVRWLRFYQTGPVCIYLIPAARSQLVEVAVAETLGSTKVTSISAPQDTPLIPPALTGKFAMANAHEHAHWLFEELDTEFDPDQTKMLPLASGAKVVGAIVFELRYPADAELFSENFKATTSIAGSVLDAAAACADQQRFAEHFARILARPRQVQKQPPAETTPLQAPAHEAPPQRPHENAFDALVEMAGGAAHELNNPLSVISGRAQLLAGAEEDPEKRRILTQIQDNARAISAAIEDLMAFAQPQQPRPEPTNIKQMLDEAVQLAGQKTSTEHVNVQIEISEGLETVFVDSAQIASAVANIICNSIESYTDTIGPVKITAAPAASGDFVRLQISDLGRGMDPETVRKATQPFFSYLPAGRKRGMGLAHAQRLIELNNGSLGIASEPHRGTTVTILLPSK